MTSLEMHGISLTIMNLVEGIDIVGALANDCPGWNQLTIVKKPTLIPVNFEYSMAKISGAPLSAN